MYRVVLHVDVELAMAGRLLISKSFQKLPGPSRSFCEWEVKPVTAAGVVAALLEYLEGGNAGRSCCYVNSAWALSNLAADSSHVQVDLAMLTATIGFLSKGPILGGGICHWVAKAV